ncbi:nucleosome-remodeling factor subunit BPTF-like [Nannospalax galili]|uniref:nucleosome-remodeling factor subunit BPTF-like n=1 Tax=Nannospalax galili TaxID=1026970 RepID=UPI00111C0BB0|nr:nucleosome-remodeling factor subunit BPTF-like [Nannospalax galili]
MKGLACNTRIWDAEAGGQKFEATPEYTAKLGPDDLSGKALMVVVVVVVVVGGLERRLLSASTRELTVYNSSCRGSNILLCRGSHVRGRLGRQPKQPATPSAERCSLAPPPRPFGGLRSLHRGSSRGCRWAATQAEVVPKTRLELAHGGAAGGSCHGRPPPTAPGAQGGGGGHLARTTPAGRSVNKVVYDDYESDEGDDDEEEDMVSEEDEEEEEDGDAEETQDSEDDEEDDTDEDDDDSDYPEEMEDDDDAASYCTESSFRSHSTYSSTPGSLQTKNRTNIMPSVKYLSISMNCP